MPSSSGASVSVFSLWRKYIMRSILIYCALLDWKSVEDQKAAVDNLAKTSYDSDLSKIFDIEAATPIKCKHPISVL